MPVSPAQRGAYHSALGLRSDTSVAARACYRRAMEQDPSPWWSRRFEAMAEIDAAFAGVVDPLAEAQVDLIERLGGLHIGDRVLDLGCGAGRHAILLQERGHRVTGVDLSARLVAAARAQWSQRHPGQPGPEFVEGDMRAPPIEGTFDLAILIDGTLGMFEHEADHLATLASVAERLRPGGSVVLELLNPYFWAHRNQTRHYPPGALAVEADLVRTWRFDAIQGRVEDRVVAFRGGDRVELPTSRVRAWVPTEVVALLAAAGFRDARVHGSTGFSVSVEPMPLEPARSAMIWVVARL